MHTRDLHEFIGRWVGRTEGSLADAGQVLARYMRHAVELRRLALVEHDDLADGLPAPRAHALAALHVLHDAPRAVLAETAVVAVAESADAARPDQSGRQ